MKGVEDIYPLSPMQQGMLVHALYAPRSEVHMEQFQCMLQGTLLVESFRAAWDSVIARHQVLRTSFLWEELDTPLQAVASNVTLPWQVLDWCALTKKVQHERLQNFLRADRQAGFDLARAPVMRVTLIQMDSQTYHLVWSFHHIVLDGWSLMRVWNDVLRSYEALSDGQHPNLPSPPPYRNYIDWLARQDMRSAESYWRQQLQTVTMWTPFGAVRPPDQQEITADHYTEETLLLSEEFTSTLSQLARRYQITLNTLVQGAWALLLSHYSGLSDVTFGSVVAGRPAEIAGVDEMVGLFINTLPTRVQIPGEETCATWLQRLQIQQVQARQYDFVPLFRLQRWSGLPPESPLFATLLVFENYSYEEYAFGAQAETSLRIWQVQVTERTLYPLSLIVQPGEELFFRASYDRTLLERRQIQGFLQHLQAILTGFAHQLERKISELALFLPQESAQLLEEWSGASKPFEAPGSYLHEVLHSHSRLRPDAIAIHSADMQLSYELLEQRANQLAHYLLKRGLGPEAIVAVCLPRSPLFPIVLAAIWKAGACYLPLDPELPVQRLLYMLEDARPALVVTENSLRSLLDEVWGGAILCIDAPQLQSQLEEQDRLLPHVMHESLQRAYVIYTSGSTGRPKGVQLSYGSLAALAQTLQDTFQLTPQDRILQFASLSFDASIFEITLAWSAGGTLYLSSRQDGLPGEPLRRVLQEQAISQATMPPSALLVTRSAGVEYLHTLVVAGEACPQHLVEDWGRGRRLINAYGPTEATIMTSGAWCHPGEEKPGIGVPLAGWQVYVLDEQCQPVPVGVQGELYIGGAGLARGYLGQASLTAERFVPHPWGRQAGERLYRSGDLVRWREDGTLEFVGRNDHQVKVRGFRIELGEIETVLHQYPGVQQAAVLSYKEGQERFLAAYVQPEAQLQLTAMALRDFLKQRLPYYMVPAAFVIMTQLPLTSSGKIDRQELQRKLPSEKADGDVYKAPRTPEEELLATIWSRLLGIPQVSIQANFFALGGHSLLATQMISQVRALFQVELPYHLVFEKPTIAELAHSVSEMRQQGPGNLPEMLPAEAARPEHVPLSYAQQRLWFLEQLQLTEALYTVLQAYRLVGPLDLVALYHSFLALVERHEVLRTTYRLEDGLPVQHILAGIEQLPLAFSVVDIRELAENEQEASLKSIRHDLAHLPFDLAQGPLLRLTLVQLHQTEQLLLLAIHHSIVDGWSLAIFYDEFFKYYTAFSTGVALDLPKLPFQYADFSLWQQHYLEGPVFEKQRTYWKQKLQDYSDLLSLPTDHPRPFIQSVRGAVSSFHLPASLLNELKQVGVEENVTLFMLLLAGVAGVLGRMSGQEDILIGTPIANRPRVELESLIGCFVNILPLRINLAKNLTGVDLLEQVRRTALEAYAHQDLPFERLVEELVPQRSLSHTPLFQVMLVLQNTRAESLTIPGVTITPDEMPRDMARFDLTFEFVETEQGLEGSIEYNRDLFEPGSIVRLQDSLQIFLEELLADIEQPISTIPLLSRDAQQQLLYDWSGSGVPREQTGTYLHEFLHWFALTQPDAIAIHFQDQQFSYRWLDQRANQLAQYLVQQGLGAEDIVGVCLQRSPLLPLAIAAIWKVGACYLPLDVQMPLHRLRYLCQDARPAFLLSSVDLQSLVEELGPDSVLFLDDPLVQAQLERVDEASPISPIEDLQRAYIIYTSGSTGHPKGVEISYRSLSILTRSLRQTLHLVPQDHILQFATLSFDASIFEITLAWGAGASLYLADKDALLPGEVLRSFLQARAISQATLPPSALLVTDSRDLPQLRTLVVAGEACPQSVVKSWGRDRRFMNAYGPTEATIMTSGAWCQPEEEQRPGIGRPLPSWQIYVLDEQWQPVPVGVVGELYIGGMGVARGYPGRPALTAERFVPHPWSQQAGARLYRSGDLVKWRHDGTLEFVGRNDHQVKVRGFRIELGEIEAVLQQYPGVQHALVTLKTSEEGDQRLIAYLLIPGPQENHRPKLIRDYLKMRLPEYMLPAAIHCLEAFPQLPNGKIDLRALPSTEIDGARPEMEYVAPRDALEERLVALWSQLLHKEHIGVTDNFFEAGGHSLLAIRLVTLIQQEWGCALSPTIVFQDGTIERLAAAIRRTPLVSSVSPLVEIQPDGLNTPLFCVHPGLGGVWGYYNLARHLSPEQPLYGLQDPYMHSDSIYYTSLEEMATSYLQAIQTIVPHGPYLLGGWSFGSIVAFEMAQQLRQQGHEVALLAIIDGGAPELARKNFQAADDATLLAIITLELARDSLGLSLQELYNELHYRDEHEQVQYVVDCLARVDADLAQNGPEWVIQQKNLFLRRINLIRGYHAQVYPGAITLFRAQSEDELEFEHGAFSHVQDMGWGRLSSLPITIEQIPGYHDTLIVEPSVQLLAERLQGRIDQVPGKVNV